MAKKKQPGSPKKDSQSESPSPRNKTIVQGYDPSANFGDILESWEKSGTLDGVSKRMKRSKPVSFEQSFGEILDQWENKGKKPKKAPAEVVKKSAPYTPTKDFGELLANFEGKQQPKAPPKKSEPKKKPRPRKLIASVEVEEALGESKKSAATWSFADTYQKWNEQSDEEKALKQAVKEKGKKKKVNEPTLSELRSQIPEATLDLHGMTVAEAEVEAKRFLHSAKEHRLRKIAFIVGKGLHNEVGYSLIKEEVERILRLSSFVSEFFTPPARYGGSGVIWVILKR